jgi:hypothetical protein
MARDILSPDKYAEMWRKKVRDGKNIGTKLSPAVRDRYTTDRARRKPNTLGDKAKVRRYEENVCTMAGIVRNVAKEKELSCESPSVP